MSQTNNNYPSGPSRAIRPDMYGGLHPSFLEVTAHTDVGGNSYEILPTAYRFFQDVAQHIGEATNAIDLQFYTLEADQAVLPILNGALAAAEERGVRVRVLTDHIVSDIRRLRPTLAAHRRANQMSTVSVQQTRPSQKRGSPFARDHKKIVTIDGTAYIGGVNLAERSLRWNDFMVRLGGPIAELVQHDFDATWEHRNSTGTSKSSPGEDGTLLITDSQQDQQILPFALSKISEATMRVWLETPYLDPNNIGRELIRAKRDNPDLDVRVIVPRFNNYPAHRLAWRRMLAPLVAAGIETFRYGVSYRRLNHAKLLLVDNTALFGSSNFNASKMAGGNSEIEVATHNPHVVAQLEDWYKEDMQESVRHNK